MLLAHVGYGALTLVDRGSPHGAAPEFLSNNRIQSGMFFFKTVHYVWGKIFINKISLILTGIFIKRVKRVAP